MPLHLAFSAWAMRELPLEQQIEIVQRAGYVGICLVSDAGLGELVPVTLHPDVSGRPQVLLMLERLLDHWKGHEGVRFVNAVLADGWLVLPGLALTAVRCSEIAWIYEKRTTYKVNGLKVGTTRDIVVHTSAGKYSAKHPLTIVVLAAEVVAPSCTSARSTAVDAPGAATSARPVAVGSGTCRPAWPFVTVTV